MPLTAPKTNGPEACAGDLRSISFLGLLREMFGPQNGALQKHVMFLPGAALPLNHKRFQGFRVRHFRRQGAHGKLSDFFPDIDFVNVHTCFTLV